MCPAAQMHQKWSRSGLRIGPRGVASGANRAGPRHGVDCKASGGSAWLEGPLDVTNTYNFTGFVAMDVTKPSNCIGFGAMDGAFGKSTIGISGRPQGRGVWEAEPPRRKRGVWGRQASSVSHRNLCLFFAATFPEGPLDDICALGCRWGGGGPGGRGPDISAHGPSRSAFRSFRIGAGSSRIGVWNFRADQKLSLLPSVVQ